jgi:DNA repair protein RadD
MPLIGLTATPYRLRGGYLHQGPDAWFEDTAYEVGVAELIEQGYLAPLTGKKPKAATFDTTGLRIERGDYRESDLAELVDDDALNRRIADEIVRCGADRRAWLVFAAGVEHAHVLRDLLEERGIAAGLVLGSTPKAERDAVVDDFRSGRLRALVNCNVLTTGFDAPELDVLRGRRRARRCTCRCWGAARASPPARPIGWCSTSPATSSGSGRSPRRASRRTINAARRQPASRR